MTIFPLNTALLIIDVQKGFDDPSWGTRNNPDAENNIALLISAWRATNSRVIHVHHDSPGASGLLRHNVPGHAAKPEAHPKGAERIYRKSVNSAFIGTTLETDLRRLKVEALVIVGLTTNHCVSTTARMAGNLGFETFVVADATAAFDRVNIDGSIRSAEAVHSAALSDLQGEFAQIIDTQTALTALTFRFPRNCGQVNHVY